MRQLVLAVVIGVAVMVTPAITLACAHTHTDQEFAMFRMLDMTPHHADGTLIVPDWVKDGKRTPEEYRNYHKDGQYDWSPLMRRM